jgi:Peptidase propeptide and YPEB domain
VPGTVHETELETSDNGYLVYEIEIAGEDGKGHEVTWDAGNGKVLYQDLEEAADEPDGRGDTEAADDGAGDTEDAD